MCISHEQRVPALAACSHAAMDPLLATRADGLGDSGDGWSAIGDEFAPELPHVKFIFPHAPLVSRFLVIEYLSRVIGALGSQRRGP